jgi:hypothetical protein
MTQGYKITIDELRNHQDRFNPINEMLFSSRVQKVLTNADILYVAELIQLTESEILNLPNSGRKVLAEVKEVLSHICLKLGAEIVPTPPSKQILREILSGARPFDPAQAVLALSTGSGPGDETDVALKQEMKYLFKDTGIELVDGKAFPKAVKKRLVAALQLARALDEYSKG